MVAAAQEGVVFRDNASYVRKHFNFHLNVLQVLSKIDDSKQANDFLQYVTPVLVPDQQHNLVLVYLEHLLQRLDNDIFFVFDHFNYFLKAMSANRVHGCLYKDLMTLNIAKQL